MTEISLEEAKAIAERLEKANDESKAILERAEKLRTMDILGGKTEAGIPKPEPDPKEKLKAEAKDMFAGTPVADALEKYG